MKLAHGMKADDGSKAADDNDRQGTHKWADDMVDEKRNGMWIAGMIFRAAR